MLTEIYISALLVNEELADQVWELWMAGNISDAKAALAWCIIGVAQVRWTVYRLCDHEMFQQPFCIKSYIQGENSTLVAVISSSR